MGNLFGAMINMGINIVFVLLLLLPILVMLGMFVLYVLLDAIQQFRQRKHPL